jgi:hypothetical protein
VIDFSDKLIKTKRPDKVTRLVINIFAINVNEQLLTQKAFPSIYPMYVENTKTNE